MRRPCASASRIALASGERSSTRASDYLRDAATPGPHDLLASAPLTLVSLAARGRRAGVPRSWTFSRALSSAA